MINPAEIPQIPGDMEALRGHAATLRSSGSSFSSTGANVHSTWQGLAAVCLSRLMIWRTSVAADFQRCSTWW